MILVERVFFTRTGIHVAQKRYKSPLLFGFGGEQQRKTHGAPVIGGAGRLGLRDIPGEDAHHAEPSR